MPLGERHELYTQRGGDRPGNRVPGCGARVNEVRNVRWARGVEHVDKRSCADVEREEVHRLHAKSVQM